jgi:hypothetical protein
METTRAISMGGTDCALPMLWAIDHKGILYYMIYFQLIVNYLSFCF